MCDFLFKPPWHQFNILEGSNLILFPSFVLNAKFIISNGWF